jgi:phosphatidylglycerol:prolipoprotein diacylglycerol transferase
MVFPQAQPYSAQYDWVREAAAKTGIPIPDPSALINLPRHPSQLYEALFEGVILWLIIWVLRNRKPFKGFLVSLYLMGYGLFRFFIEYFREPDADLGYRIELIPNALPPALAHPPLSFSTGQILSLLMVAAGILWLIAASRLPNRKPVRVYPDPPGRNGGPAGPAAQAKEAARNKRRKLRKKLQQKKHP